MPTPCGSRGGVAFSADELRVLGGALAIALQSDPAPERSREYLRLARSVEEAAREGDRLRAFLLADLARYREALPGAATGYLDQLEGALTAGHLPRPDDLAALRSLCAEAAGERESARRRALLHRCESPRSGPYAPDRGSSPVAAAPGTRALRPPSRPRRRTNRTARRSPGTSRAPAGRRPHGRAPRPRGPSPPRPRSSRPGAPLLSPRRGRRRRTPRPRGRTRRRSGPAPRSRRSGGTPFPSEGAGLLWTPAHRGGRPWTTSPRSPHRS